MVKKQIITTGLLVLLLTSCLPEKQMQIQPMDELKGGMISTAGTRFVDSAGREVIFNGINVVNKNPAENYIFRNTDSIFSRYSRYGFNCVRLGIIWDAVEPEPGKFNEEYLDRIEEQVQHARDNGMYVLLDMHQDLFSVLYSDGAPRWATLSEGEPHYTGTVWSDSYFISPAVQRAFDNFWKNAPASDGKGIQDHYADMWKHIAERFSGNNTVIGYDIMNEPFNGSPGTMILPVILKAYGTLYAKETGKILNSEELMSIWENEDTRMEALEWMSSIDRYSAVISSATELSQSFERNELQSMYQRVADRIRTADTSHILFLEHAYFSNAGVKSGVTPVKQKNGMPDRRVAYAAHGYDLLVDTRYYGKSSRERIEYIFSQVREVSDTIVLPVLIGEWGAFSGNSPEIADLAKWTLSLFDRLGFSQTYWAHYEGADNALYFTETFLRPYPRYINGTMISSGYNYATGEFMCKWHEPEESGKSSVFFVPNLKNLVREKIILLPSDQNIIIQPGEKGDGGFIIIPPSGKPEERSISFRLEKNVPSISIIGDKD